MSRSASWSTAATALLLTAGPLLACSEDVLVGLTKADFSLQVKIAGEGRVVSDDGAVDCPELTCISGYRADSGVVLHAVPTDRTIFAGWSGTECIGSTPACDVVMDRSKRIGATFLPTHVVLSVRLEGDGGGRVRDALGGIDCGDDCVETYALSSTSTRAIVLHPVLLPGSAFVGFGGACTGQTCQVTMDRDQVVSAFFVQDEVAAPWTWSPLPWTSEAPSPRWRHQACWTGREMVIWGGMRSTTVASPLPVSNDGSAYEPTETFAPGQWTKIAADPNVPPRHGHGMICSSMGVAIWGGCPHENCAAGETLQSGWRRALHDPVHPGWEPLPASNQPVARNYAQTLWTGSKMIILGGTNGAGSGLLLDGGMIDPLDANADWSRFDLPREIRALPASRRPLDVCAVWTGTEIVVLFGDIRRAFHASLDATPDATGFVDLAWVETPPVPAELIPRTQSFCTSHQGELFVWGGTGPGFALQNGARYRIGGAWQMLTTSTGTGPDPVWREVEPRARTEHTLVVVGSEIIAWGGSEPNSTQSFDTGGHFVLTPGDDYWYATALFSAPSPRNLHTAVWTGRSMIVWGGTNPSGAVAGDGAEYHR